MILVLECYIIGIFYLSGIPLLICKTLFSINSRKNKRWRESFSLPYYKQVTRVEAAFDAQIRHPPKSNSQKFKAWIFAWI